jgi:putative tributyrin esterase
MRRAMTTVAAVVLMHGASTGAQQTPTETPGAVIQVPSTALKRQQAVMILLPTTYNTSQTKRYPVLYLLHGGGQDHTAFSTRNWFRAQASREMIVITPNAEDSWYVNSAVDPVAKYEDFVIRDLVGYIDSHYRTIPTRQGRAVAGISMGAWGAMLIGLKHHRLFGAVGAMSAPFGISRQAPDMDMTSKTQQRFGSPMSPERLDRDPGTIVTNIPLDSVPKLYLACGSLDLFVQDNRSFVQRLAERKIPYEYHELSPFGHSWDVWDGQLVAFIEMMSNLWVREMAPPAVP